MTDQPLPPTATIIAPSEIKPTTATAVTSTAAISISAVSLVPAVKWAFDGFPAPAPDTVTYLAAAALLIALHFIYASATALAEKWGVKIPTV